MAGCRGKGSPYVHLRDLGVYPANLRCRYRELAQDDSAIPNILMRPIVTATRPGANGGQPRQINIPNPLYSTVSLTPA